MRKLLLTSGGVCLTLASFAQLPVSTTPQNRKVVLEEFTGIHCQYCPDGHKRANELKASKPAGSVVLVNVHTGGYAQPNTGEPDFRTSEGNSIAAISGMNITGYPTGSINRHTFVGQAGMAINRGDWARYADSTLAKSSYVNVALEGSLNVTTRVLTVNVQAYYTATSSASANNLTVMLIEDSVRGPQIDSGPFYPAMHNADGTYTHNHLLRKVITPAMGEAISPMTSGTTINKTYTYTVPAQFVNNSAQLGNLHVIAFIAEGNSEIMTAGEGHIALTGIAYNNDASMSSVKAEAEVCAGKLNPVIKVENQGSTTITAAAFSYNVNGGTNSTYNFAGYIRPYTTQEISLPLINFTPTATNTLNVNVTGVNGGSDQNAANNVLASGSIPMTSRAAADKTMTMTFTQDQWGSESSWKVYNEVTGAVIAQDGPFTDLSAAGTAVHVKTFTIAANTCYKLEVLDAFGDGINSTTYGLGKYELKSGATALVTSNGQYGKGENKWYKSNATLTNLAVGNLSNNFSEVAVFPNPARDNATLAFDLKQRADVTISVLDMTGRVVSLIAQSKFEAGSNKVTINTAAMAAGLYNVRIQSENGAQVERLSVVK